jgi:cyclophilin family peptidyl-prolyl cis-trans isomerase
VLFVVASALVAAVGCYQEKAATPTPRKPPEPAAEKPAAPAAKPAAPAAKPAAPAADVKESAATQPAAASNRVVIDTSLGKITVELDPEKAPITVKNFLQYVDDKFYDGTIFHRVIPNFMIQGGGFQPGMKEKPTRPPIRNEGTNGLKNLRGTIAMARTGNPHSATAQFFINVVDNRGLDHPRIGPDGKEEWGYCVFGKVVNGMDVVDKIRTVPTHTVGPFADVPQQDVIINSIRRE